MFKCIIQLINKHPKDKLYVRKFASFKVLNDISSLMRRKAKSRLIHICGSCYKDIDALILHTEARIGAENRDKF